MNTDTKKYSKVHNEFFEKTDDGTIKFDSGIEYNSDEQKSLSLLGKIYKEKGKPVSEEMLLSIHRLKSLGFETGIVLQKNN